MRQLVYIVWFVLLIQKCFAPPVTQNVKKEGEEPDSDVGGLEDYMEYHRYLKEVVNALESDPDFRNKLEKASEDEIRSGKIADQLEFVSHHVRTRLDEIKRVELQRLKELTEKKRRLENDVNVIDNEDPLHHHLDHNNPHSFEIEDLKKLIAKTTEDLAEADKKRKEDFKRYEMEKEYQMQDKLNHTNGTEREQLEKEYKEMAEKHKKHEKLHEPGHKAQLEEVWQEQDQMQQDFNPKTFFMLHDIDGNGLWDQEEVKALFIKELDKMYQEGAPEDDMRERVEEMERMRESVFDEMDKNRDGFIDFQEFLQQTNTNDFKQDHGWQGIDERKPYTDEELQEYIRMHHANQIPPQYYQQGMPQMPPGAYQQVPPGYHPNAVPSGGQFHPGQVPQSPPQALHGSQGYLNTNEIYPDQQQYHQQPNYQQQYQPPPPPGYQQYPNPPVGQQQQYQQAQHQQQQNPQANQQQQFQQAQHPQAGQQQQYQQAQHPQASQQQAQNQQQQQYQQGQNAQQQQQQYQPPPPQAAVPQAGQQQQPQQNQQVPQQNQHVQGQPVEHVAQQNQAAQQQVPA